LLPPLEPWAQAAGGAMVLASLWLMPKGWGVPQASPRKVMARWIAMGFFSWLLVLTVLRDAALLFVDGWATETALAVLGLTPVITAVGFLMARRVARLVDVRVPVDKLPASLEGFTIAQISDVHVGPTIKREFVQRIVDRVNGMDADLVAITGDLVDGSVAQLASHTAPLADLKSRHGTYVVTGNHEYYSGAQAWIGELERLGARVLMNEHVMLDHDGGRLAIAGVTDFSAHHFDPSHASDPRRAMKGVPDGAVKVLLAHQPRSAPSAAAAGYDLQLSGHTHGGQFWPWNHFVRFSQPFTSGLHRLGRMWIYISRGTGYWGPPMRFGIPSEITRIRLVRA
ncbi:MAG: metallophosphoesterase, partial [Burkholderiales bacterium]|nr:metallophosphoesterase [Burkholderiales bacterium]